MIGISIRKFFCIFLIAFIAACTTTKTIIYYSYSGPGVIKQEPVHILIDKAFAPDQEQMLSLAFKSWEEAGGGKIKFIPHWRQERPKTSLKNSLLFFDSGIFIWRIPKNKDHLSDKEMVRWGTSDGATIFGPGSNSGNIVIFDYITDPNRFYAVSLHEVGHLLGLSHTGHNGVMGIYAEAYCITPSDAIQLCELYGCRPQSTCIPWL